MASYRGSSTSVEDAQSTPQTRRNQRLSKPRTNTSPTILLNASSSRLDLSPSDPPRQSPANVSDSTAVMPVESSKSRRESRQKLREHLFGSDQAIDTVCDSDEEPVRSGSVEAPRGVRERFSRTGSMIAKRKSIRISLNPLAKSFSSSSLAREPSIEAVDEGNIMDEVKQRVFNDRIAAMNHKSPTLEERDEIERVISPIRRRSLFTPGLATRDPNNILRKPPIPVRRQTEDDHDHYFNPNLSEFSPLSRLAALDLANPERSSPVSRSATPADLDYGHLGGFGSLRITNGVTSPVPSMRSIAVASRKSSSNLRYQEEYFGTQDSTVPVLREIHRRSGEYVDFLDTAERADRQSGEIGRIARAREGQYEQMQGGSPLKHERSHTSLYPDEDACGGRLSSIAPRQTEHSLKWRSDDHTSCMAQKYMDELPQNPFTVKFESVFPSTSIQVTSKPSELDDELFDQQSLRSESPQQSLHRWTAQLPEVGQNRGSFEGEVLGMLDNIRGSRSSFNTKQTSDYPTAADERLSQYPAGPSSATSKSDSGYGSSTSLKSLQKHTIGCPDENTARSGVDPQLKERHPSKPCAKPVPESSPRTSTISRPSLLTVPSSSVFDGSIYNSTQTSSEIVPTLASSKTSNMQQPTPSKRLRKIRPKSQPPPVSRITVQGLRDVSASHIPPVPTEIAARNAARLRNCPPLEHTLPSVDHEGFRDYTPILAPLSAPLRFPSPTRPEKPRNRSTSNRNNENVAPSSDVTHQRPTQKPFNLRRLSQSFRRSSRQQMPDPDEHVDMIADFGEVADSLGHGPYDIASASFHSRSVLNRDSAMHPHQMTALGRGRAPISMNEEEAAQLSRMRGMYGRRASPDIENGYFYRDEQAGSNLKPRPPIHIRHSFDDRGGIPGKMPKANDTSTDTPPVPAIPVAIQVERREAELAQRSSNQSKQTPPTRPSILRPTNERFSTSNFAELRPDWQSHRDAWAQRRKSAGEALAASEENSRTPSPIRAEQEVPVQAHWHDAPVSQESQRSGTTFQNRSSLNFQPSSQSSSSLQLDQSLSLNPNPSGRNLAIPKGTVARLSGRFEGGFGFGYEPGFGVGGSAGTRGIRTGASRKSVDVSRGFGIDLSDVPVFVSPS